MYPLRTVPLLDGSRAALRSPSSPRWRRSSSATLVALTALALLAPGPLRGGKKDKEGKDKETGRVVARTRSAFDTLWLLPEKGPGKPLALFADVPADSRLFTAPGQRGHLDVKEGDLRVTLIGNLPELSPSPALETAVRLLPSKEHDIEIKLERGILLIEANKESPGGSVRIGIGDKHIDARLFTGSMIAVELYSRWPEGVPFFKKAKPGHQPVLELWFFVLRGKADVTLLGEKNALSAPLVFHWNSLGGVEGPAVLKKVPEWIDPAGLKDKQALALLKAAEAVRRRLEKNENAWSEALGSKDANERIVALYRTAAVDKLDPVISALNNDKTAAVRAAAVNVLGRYMGRGQPQDIAIYDALVEAKFKPGQAEIFMYLLHGFTPDALTRPETYESLISYLQHDLMAIRHLAAQHLLRVAPDGKDIAYDPAADAEMRASGQAAWRKLIPEGTLPKAPSKK